MKIRCLIVILCCILLSTNSILAQTENEFIVPTLECTSGTTANIPIELKNSDEVVAIQFNLQLPSIVQLSDGDITLTDRCSSHLLSVKNQGDNNYLFLIYSLSNAAIRGNSGTLVNIAVEIPTNASIGNNYSIDVENLILTAKSGDKLDVTTTNGAMQIVVGNTPDFVVQEVSMVQEQIEPGDSLCVNWQVKNIGKKSADAGWLEKVYLVNSSGEQILIGEQNQLELLATDELMYRSATFALAEKCGIDGEVQVIVKLTPFSDSGELSTDIVNNVAQSLQGVIVGKKLTLEIATTLAEQENSTNNIGYLYRSGSRSVDQSFTLSNSNSSRLTLPSTITIPQGQSGVTFIYATVDDSFVNSDSCAILTISGNTYPEISQTIWITDDEEPTLAMTYPEKEIVEGETFSFTITRELVTAAPLEVTLTSDQASKFSYDKLITIPANESSVQVDITAINDDQPDVTTEAVFTAVASGYKKALGFVTLLDDDIPEIDLEITPATFSESAGPQAAIAILRRTSVTNNIVTINLTDNSGGVIYYPTSSIVLESGVEEYQFAIGAVNDELQNGERKVELTASVYISTCSCSTAGTEMGYIAKELTITDDDGATLKIASSQNSLLEGYEQASILTISHNTDTSYSLAVTLESDRPDEVVIPSTIEIPSGETSVNIPVAVNENLTTEGSRTIAFTASADGYATATCWAMITDQSLPDAVISSIQLSNEDDVYALDTKVVEIVVGNSGVIDLPAMTKVNLYLTDNNNLLSSSYKQLINTYYTQTAIAPDQTESISKSITLPDKTGKYYLVAVVDEAQEQAELTHLNNTLASQSIEMKALYTFEVSTNSSTYKPDDSILIKGKASGKDVNQVAVELYLINNSNRQVVDIETDATGNFEYTFQPETWQLGHFYVGACYPNEGLSEAMDEFDIYGLKKSVYGNSDVTWDISVDEYKEGEISVQNLSEVEQSNIQVEILSKPEGCELTFEPISTISPLGKAALRYTVSSNTITQSETSYEQIKVKVTSDEGASFYQTIYLYVESLKPLLTTDNQTINTTVVKDSLRNYSITIRNIGKGDTGTLTLYLPTNSSSWLSASTPSTIPSLSQGDSTTIVLQFSPSDDAIAQTTENGTFVVTAANDNVSLLFTYSIEVVSTNIGELIVDVCDELTYNTEEKPHLADAKVEVRHPFTSALIADGTTDSEGLFKTEIPDGYYTLKVSADKHSSYTNTIIVDPGTVNKKTVDLQSSLVIVDWDVEVTQVEDSYVITTTVEYETNVPRPVLVVDFPDDLSGDEQVFPIIVTNTGLISALNVYVDLPEVDGLTFEMLTDAMVDTLPAQSSTTFYVRMTTNSDSSTTPPTIDDSTDTGIGTDSGAGTGTDSGAGTDLGTDTGTDTDTDTDTDIDTDTDTDATVEYNPAACIPFTLGVYYSWYCGVGNTPIGHSVANYARGTCALDAISSWASSYTSSPSSTSSPAEPTKSSGEGTSYTSDSSTEYPVMIRDCHDCEEAFINNSISCAVSFIPGFGCLFGLGTCALTWMDSTSTDKQKAWCSITAIGGCIPIADIATSIVSCMLGLLDPCDVLLTRSVTSRSTDSDMPAYISLFQERMGVAIKEYNVITNVCIELFGDESWVGCDEEELNSFYNTFLSLAPLDNPITYEELSPYKPMFITAATLQYFVDRWNNTRKVLNGESVASDNYVDMDSLTDYMAQIDTYEQMAIGYGYDSMSELFDAEIEKMNEEIESPQSSVCASISLQFEQSMCMTREAFRGTLTVFNGHESVAMTDVKLDLVVCDSEGNIATSQEFQISNESIETFTGELDGYWSLDAQETGKATILFIPTKYAAPTEAVNYQFGGTLTYTDPYSGLVVTIDLNAVELAVNPSPNLKLTYFMQRDILGDDALTTDVVEPSVPAEFSLLIHNIGAGEAQSVKMLTQQPEIIDNEKGLYIDFELVSSQLNGEDKNLALGGSVETSFGNIEAGSTAYAQWMLTSSLLGHFTSYSVETTHLTSYDNPNLSLLDTVTIHELIKSIKVPQSELTGFLVNDILDSDDLPDMLYLSDGSIEVVASATNATISKGTEDNTYLLTVTPSQNGWNYGYISDPTAGAKELIAIERLSDGVTINLANIWQTSCTLQDGKDPIYENRIHFVDSLSTSPVSYKLTFEDTPDVVLEVSSLTGSEGDSVYDTPIQTITATFNKAIDHETFTMDDLKLTCQGVVVDIQSVEITKVTDTQYTIDLSTVTDMDGYYVLTLYASQITDTEGYLGVNGKSATWTQLLPKRVTKQLEQGWNWLSVNPYNQSDYSTIFFPIIAYIDSIYGADALLYPSSQMLDINQFSPTASYKVSANQNVEIEWVTPSILTGDEIVELERGWNWIGYVPPYTQSLALSLQNLMPHEGDVIKSQDAFSIYDGSSWIGGLTDLIPGEGYLYYTDSPNSFVYNSADNDSEAEPSPATTWEYNAHLTANNTLAIAQIHENGIQVEGGKYHVGAFVQNECRGVAVEKEGYFFITTHVNPEELEKVDIELRAYNIDEDRTYIINENIEYADYLYGDINNPIQLTIGFVTGISTSSNNGLFVYPSRVKSTIYIRGDWETIEQIRIYNTLGQQVLLQSTNTPQGIHVSSLPSGLYIVSIRVGDEIFHQSFIKE